MTTANTISMTTDTFISLLPFDLDSETATRYLANLNEFRSTKVDGRKHQMLWMHVEALKLAISYVHTGLVQVLMTEKVFLHDLSFNVNEYIEQQLEYEMAYFQEEVLASEDTFKPLQLNLAFARVVENYIL